MILYSTLEFFFVNLVKIRLCIEGQIREMQPIISSSCVFVLLYTTTGIITRFTSTFSISILYTTKESFFNKARFSIHQHFSRFGESLMSDFEELSRLQWEVVLHLDLMLY